LGSGWNEYFKILMNRNVFNAMGLKLHPILEHICCIVERKSSQLSVAIDGLSGMTSSSFYIDIYSNWGTLFSSLRVGSRTAEV
jgi:hypothetical protein